MGYSLSGTRDETAQAPHVKLKQGTSVSPCPDSTTENTGSAALMTCVKLTAIFEKLTHADTCPTAW